MYRAHRASQRSKERFSDLAYSQLRVKEVANLFLGSWRAGTGAFETRLVTF